MPTIQLNDTVARSSYDTDSDHHHSFQYPVVYHAQFRSAKEAQLLDDARRSDAQ